MFPSNIRMGSKTTPIKKIKGLIARKGIMGQSHSFSDIKKKWKVLIDAGMNKKDTAQTVLHEAVHQISDLHDINLKERQVEDLSNALVYSFTENTSVDELRSAISKIDSLKGLKLSDIQITKLAKALKYIGAHNPKFMSTIKKMHK